MGPKAVESLEKLKVNLEDSLDYGIFSFHFAKPLMSILRFFHGIVGNWGVAIILLTIVVKIIFYPLTHVSMRNMKEMQKTPAAHHATARDLQGRQEQAERADHGLV